MWIGAIRFVYTANLQIHISYTPLRTNSRQPRPGG
jgi:hypothetical protein